MGAVPCPPSSPLAQVIGAAPLPQRAARTFTHVLIGRALETTQTGGYRDIQYDVVEVFLLEAREGSQTGHPLPAEDLPQHRHQPQHGWPGKG